MGQVLLKFNWSDLQRHPNVVSKALNDQDGLGAILLPCGRGQVPISTKKAAIMDFLPVIGYPIHVYKRKSLWKNIGVSLGPDLDRVGGTGDIPLHLDLVNASLPPDYIVFVCERPDANGGGINVVSPFRPSLNLLDKEFIDALSTTYIEEGSFYDLDHVGHHLERFPVIELGNKCIKWVRFTAKKSAIPLGANAELIENFHTSLRQQEVEVLLKAGDVLIVNQRLAAHGRKRLYGTQNEISEEKRRSLFQLFVRSANSSKYV
ncbi:MAG: TauD/TfdA family dioxygenase [Gammaproteobacteria bacterium]|nr:TauD/TfdA family dioxygenase [Gammaproteobacteria bacterium]